MSFINNKRDNIISAKITEIGRKKIALGKLNYAKWVLGDSEINYNRENTGLIPPKILLPADSQPNIKYFVTDDPNLTDVTKEISENDINLVKLTSKSISTLRGSIKNTDLTSTFFKKSISIVKGMIGKNSIKFKTAIDKTILVGDNILIDENDIFENTSYTYFKKLNYPIFKIIEISSDRKQIKLNRHVGILSRVETYIGYVYDGRDVLDVPEWNKDETINWNSDIMTYDLPPTSLNNSIRPLSFNIVTLEQLAGYVEADKTYGDRFLGFIENYLSFNDDLNSESDVIVEACSENLIKGEVDNFKKIVGIIHFENGHHNNLYGDSFLVDNQLEVTLPFVLHNSIDDNGVVLTSKQVPVNKKVIDSNIIYNDLYIKNTDIVVGKILPQFKVIIIEDEELVTAMSIGSGRNFMLPNIEGKLIPSEDGLLLSGEQIFVTYKFDTSLYKNDGGFLINENFHCNKYLLIKNNTISSKDVELKFKSINDLKHMVNINVNKYEGYSGYKFKVIYQVTKIGERPKPDKWLEVDYTDGNTIKDPNNNEMILNPIALTSNQFYLNKNITSYGYNLDHFTKYNSNVYSGLIGDDKVLLGSFITRTSTITYKSLIQIRINTNQVTYTTNPTRFNDSKPVMVSEIGIYDNENDLVMIAKLSNPIELSTKSTILIELSMDF